MNKNPKYVIAVDHTADYGKEFTYIACKNVNRIAAFVEAGVRAMQEESVYCFHVLERRRNGEYTSLVRCYKGGTVEPTNQPWGFVAVDK